MNRRDFLASTVAAGGAMVLGFHLPPASARAAEGIGELWYRDALVPEVNAWLTIAPDDAVTIRVAQTEMGSGVFTSCPMPDPQHKARTGGPVDAKDAKSALGLRITFCRPRRTEVRSGAAHGTTPLTLRLVEARRARVVI